MRDVHVTEVRIPRVDADLVPGAAHDPEAHEVRRDLRDVDGRRVPEAGLGPLGPHGGATEGVAEVEEIVHHVAAVARADEGVEGVRTAGAQDPGAVPAQVVAVLCEGTVTEPRYLNRLKRYLHDNGLDAVNINVVPSKRSAPVNVVDRAMQLTGYDEVWCFVDVEAPVPHATLMTAVSAASRNSIRLGYLIRASKSGCCWWRVKR